MAYKYQNYCFATIDPAVDMLTSANSANSVIQSVSVDPSTAVVLMRLKSKATGKVTTQTTYLSTHCDEISERATFDKMHINDLVFSAVLVLVFVLGFGQGKILRP